MTRVAILVTMATVGLTGAIAAQQTLRPEEVFEYQNAHETAGSAEAGRPIFEKTCAACHRFGDAIGREVGPDLSTIASRFKRRDVLEAILWPSKVISDQYRSEMFEMKDNSVLSGVVARENATQIFLRTAENPDRLVPVPKAQVANRGESTVSLMPAGLLDGRTQEEIASLLAFVMAPPPAK